MTAKYAHLSNKSLVLAASTVGFSAEKIVFEADVKDVDKRKEILIQNKEHSNLSLVVNNKSELDF